jgi:predicted dehydrogenase
VCGAGLRAGDHLATIHHLNDLFEIVGICDSDARRRTSVGSRFGVRAYPDLPAMLRDARPEALLVATPPDAHRAAVELAAHDHVHVLCETPLAPTLPLADAMISAAARGGILLEVAENAWRWPMAQLKRRVVSDGLIGSTTQVHMRYPSGAHHGMSLVRQFATTPPTRAIGYMRSTRVPPFEDRFTRPVFQEPYELGVIEFADGVVATFQAPLRQYPNAGFDVLGTKGAIIEDHLVVFDPGRKTYPLRVRRSTAPPRAIVEARLDTSPPIVWSNPFGTAALGSEPDAIARAEILTGFWRVIRAGGPMDYGPSSARADQELAIAIRESARQASTWISLPLVEPTDFELAWHRSYEERYGHDPLGPIDAAIATSFPSMDVRDLSGRSGGSARRSLEG